MSVESGAQETVTYTWTGPPGVVWIKKPPLQPFLFFQLLLVLGGAALGYVLGTTPGERSVKELTAEEKRLTYFAQKTEPMTISLRILSNEEFARRRAQENTAAFSISTRSPCEIYIPAGWTIISNPKDGVAIFGDGLNASTLAHEMLHCLRGSWHPDWKQIHSESGRSPG